MKSLTQIPKNLLSNWFSNPFQAILIVFFLVWTPLLVAGTLQVQHSCHPMINWSNTLPAECNSSQSKFNEKDKSLVAHRPETEKPKKQQKSDSSKEQKSIAQLPKPSPTPTPQTPDTSSTKQPNQIEKTIELAKDNPEITGAIVGIGIAATLAIVASAPLVVCVGFGLLTSAAVWYGVQTVL